MPSLYKFTFLYNTILKLWCKLDLRNHWTYLNENRISLRKMKYSDSVSVESISSSICHLDQGMASFWYTTLDNPACSLMSAKYLKLFYSGYYESVSQQKTTTRNVVFDWVAYPMKHWDYEYVKVRKCRKFHYFFIIYGRNKFFHSTNIKDFL